MFVLVWFLLGTLYTANKCSSSSSNVVMLLLGKKLAVVVSLFIFFSLS